MGVYNALGEGRRRLGVLTWNSEKKTSEGSTVPFTNRFLVTDPFLFFFSKDVTVRHRLMPIRMEFRVLNEFGELFGAHVYREFLSCIGDVIRSVVPRGEVSFVFQVPRLRVYVCMCVWGAWY